MNVQIYVGNFNKFPGDGSIYNEGFIANATSLINYTVYVLNDGILMVGKKAADPIIFHNVQVISIFFKCITCSAITLVVFILPLLPHVSNAQVFKPDTSSLFQVEEADEILISTKDTIYINNDTITILTNYLIRKKDTLFEKNSPPSVHLAIMPREDTIVTIKDTVRISSDTVLTLNERVLGKIESFSKKDTRFSKLFRNVVVFEDKPNPAEQVIPHLSAETATKESRYQNHEGKIIGNIHIEVLNVLGFSMTDSTKKPRSLLEKGGNAIHIKTHKRIIRNKLLFKTNEKLNSIKVAESERLLRQTNFIYDANITLKSRGTSDTVDVYVRTQDLWSLTGGAAIDFPVTTTDLSIREVNFLGLGQQLDNAVKINNNLPSGFNYVGGYFVNNIYRTQSNGHLFYRYEYGEKRTGIGVNREFLSSSIIWAGGINFARNHLITINPIDSSRRPLGVNIQDIWLGYALQGMLNKWYTGNRIFITSRFLRTHFFERPDFIAHNQYISNRFYLASIGYFHRSFYKDNYIFQLGRTEDIPEGKLFSITAGLQNGASYFRRYLGIETGFSKLIKRVGYFYWSGGLGSFRNKDRWEEGTFYLKYLYYTPLVKFGTWRMRNFFSVRIYSAINYPVGNLTNINRENGLRGLSSDVLIGSKKIAINYENDFFPNINFLGFRFGLLVFADWAWIGNNPQFVNKDNFFHGYGVGVRIRNENLIFSMVQLLIGFYPNAPDIDKQRFQFFERTKYFYNFNLLEFSRPSPLPIY